MGLLFMGVVCTAINRAMTAMVAKRTIMLLLSLYHWIWGREQYRQFVPGRNLGKFSFKLVISSLEL